MRVPRTWCALKLNIFWIGSSSACQRSEKEKRMSPQLKCKQVNKIDKDKTVFKSAKVARCCLHGGFVFLN
jgi:hypothetical protein